MGNGKEWLNIDTCKQITVNGKVFGNGMQPLVCTPLIGKDKESILQELGEILTKQPDLIEWRVDFFETIARTDKVIEVAKEIKQAAGSIPLLFTRRSQKEGGQPIKLSEIEVAELYSAICGSKAVDVIDYELSSEAIHFQNARKHSLANGIKMVASYHNFEQTPDKDFIVGKLTMAEQMGADIAKVAVMPNGLEDVLTLLHATLYAKRNLNIPCITMSMGPYGSLTRMVGGVFGSAVTFAVGENSSAPGQVPIEDLKTVLAIIEKSVGGN